MRRCQNAWLGRVNSSHERRVWLRREGQLPVRAYVEHQQISGFAWNRPPGHGDGLREVRSTSLRAAIEKTFACVVHAEHICRGKANSHLSGDDAVARPARRLAP